MEKLCLPANVLCSLVECFLSSRLVPAYSVHTASFHFHRVIALPPTRDPNQCGKLDVAKGEGHKNTLFEYGRGPEVAFAHGKDNRIVNEIASYPYVLIARIIVLRTHYTLSPSTERPVTRVVRFVSIFVYSTTANDDERDLLLTNNNNNQRLFCFFIPLQLQQR